MTANTGNLNVLIKYSAIFQLPPTSFPTPYLKIEILSLNDKGNSEPYFTLERTSGANTGM